MNTSTNLSQAPSATLDDPFLFLSPRLASNQNAAERSLNFAQMDPTEALQSIIAIRANDVGDKFLMDDDGAFSALRAALQDWMEVLRHTELPGLVSPLAREQNLRKVIASLLTQAYQQKSKVWTTALPTGQQILIACSQVVDEFGIETLCQFAHEQIVRQAQRENRPFSRLALDQYGAATPTDVH